MQAISARFIKSDSSLSINHLPPSYVQQSTSVVEHREFLLFRPDWFERNTMLICHSSRPDRDSSFRYDVWSWRHRFEIGRWSRFIRVFLAQACEFVAKTVRAKLTQSANRLPPDDMPQLALVFALLTHMFLAYTWVCLLIFLPSFFKPYKHLEMSV